MSSNPWEVRQLVKAARKYERIVQVGTQNRSVPDNLEAKEYLDSGKLGEVTMVRVAGRTPASASMTVSISV